MLEVANKDCMKRMNVNGCGMMNWTEKRQNIYLLQSRCCSIVFNAHSEKRLCKLLGPISTGVLNAARIVRLHFVRQATTRQLQSSEERFRNREYWDRVICNKELCGGNLRTPKLSFFFFLATWVPGYSLLQMQYLHGFWIANSELEDVYILCTAYALHRNWYFLAT